jgi:glycosyltransferase involved in cell wall biosynthesis
MRLVVVSAFWNASNYIERCITSVMSQEFTDFTMYLIDDMSDDDTVSKIESLISNDKRFKLIVNTEKKYKLRNFDDLIMDEELIDDEDIIIELDGDDWLYDENVLEKVYNKYNKNKNLWMTNGSFIYSNGQIGFSSKVNPSTVRKDPFRLSHLRTWKSHLWRSIEEESFIGSDGEYFRSAPDVAYSFPMVEMAGDKHYEFIPDIMYVYNAESPYNEHKPNSSDGGLQSQSSNDNYIRNMKPYRPL